MSPSPSRNPLRVFGRPKMAALLFLGFSSGLPLYLTKTTLAGVDDDRRRESHRDWSIQSPQRALLAEVRLGAGTRPVRAAVPRQAARMDADHPDTPADQHRVDVAARSEGGIDGARNQRTRHRIPQRVAGHHNRRVPHGHPHKGRAGARHVGLRPRLPHRSYPDRVARTGSRRPPVVADDLRDHVDADDRRHHHDVSAPRSRF